MSVASGALPVDDVGAHDVYGLLVGAAHGNNQVGIPLGGLYEFLMHGLENLQVSVYHSLRSSSSLQCITLYHPDEPLVGVCIDKQFQVHQVAKLFLPQGHDALYDNHFAWLHMYGLFQAVAHQITVGGLLDGLSTSEFHYVFGEQLPVEGIGVVKVDLPAVLHTQMRIVIVIGVLWDDRHASRGQCLQNLPNYCGLARPCSTCYSYYIHVG